MSGKNISTIITHLTSKTIGVNTIDDLRTVSQKMLPPTVELSMVVEAKLLKAFQNATGKSICRHEGTAVS